MSNPFSCSASSNRSSNTCSCPPAISRCRHSLNKEQSKPSSVRLGPSTYFQSTRSRTAPAACRSESPSANVAGPPPTPAAMRRSQAAPRRKTAWPTARPDTTRPTHPAFGCRHSFPKGRSRHLLRLVRDLRRGALGQAHDRYLQALWVHANRRLCYPGRSANSIKSYVHTEAPFSAWPWVSRTLPSKRPR